MNINFLISILALTSIMICSITVLYSYHKLKLKIILLYFIGIFLLSFATIAMTIGTLPVSGIYVKNIQSVMFSLTWGGIYFIYLAMKFSNGNKYSVSTNITSALIGVIIALYMSGNFYDVAWDINNQTWTMQFHPFLLGTMGILMVFVMHKLITVSKKLYHRSRNSKVKNNLRIFFMGWITMGLSSVFLGINMIIKEIPSYLFLICFSIGLGFISLSIYRLPSGLIASTNKIYAMGFIERDKGALVHFYDFSNGSRPKTIEEPVIFSGVMAAVDISLKHSIQGCRYLKIIDAGPRKILIERGYHTQAIMIVEQQTPLLENILKRLLIMFELKYYEQLDHFRGEVSQFQPFDRNIEQYMAFAL